jgi:chemotaxis protein CheZ
MTAARQKSFRIEQIGVVNTQTADAGDLDGARHRELMRAINELQNQFAPQQEVSTELLDRYRAEMQEAQKIKSELDEIYRTIAETKKDIATLHHTGFGEEQITTVSNQLDAVVAHTESATEVILAAAERIDNDASNLSASLTGSENEMAADIQDQVVKIFESCNFQDITGQRITKVIDTLKFIEERVTHMIDIWGGIDSFNGVAPVEMDKPAGDAALLNGPALPNEASTATQDDIDALFG